MSTRRSNPSLTTSLCVSLIAHGLGLSAIAWWFVRHSPPPHTAGFTDADVARVMLSPKAIPRPRPKPPKRQPPPPLPPDDARPFKDDSGEHDGHGNANRSTPGAQAMRAAHAVDQADLMRAKLDDPSLIDPTAALTAQAGQRVRDDAVALSSEPARQGAYHPEFVAEAKPDGAGETAARSPRDLGPLPPTPPLTAPTEPDDDAPAVPSGTRDATAQASPSIAPPPPARRMVGRAASASDTDSEAFSADADHTFVAGEVDGRNGKKVQGHKVVFGLASENELTQIGGLRASFALRIRPDGTVADVQTVHSSGSANADQDCNRALWMFKCEPDVDKAGHPVPTVWVILYE